MANVLGLKAFELERVLEMDPEFLGDGQLRHLNALFTNFFPLVPALTPHCPSPLPALSLPPPCPLPAMVLASHSSRHVAST